MASGRAYLRGRVVGKLVSLYPKYGFISTGADNPEYFVHRFDVPAEAWFEGSLLEFTPAPPVPPGKRMRAENIVPRNREEEKAS